MTVARQHVLELQRARRSRMRRIDFYVSPAASQVIDRFRSKRVGGDASSIINRIIDSWSQGEHDISGISVVRTRGE